MPPRLLNPAGALRRPPPTRGEAEAALAHRVRAVLETRPGTLPWRPTFGCALDRFLDQPLTPDRLKALERELRSALERWLPDVQVVRVQVEVLTDLGLHRDGAWRSLPIAERALVQLGAHAALQVDLELGVDGRVSYVQARIHP
jgi:phage baseplate assembly protein W